VRRIRHEQRPARVVHRGRQASAAPVIVNVSSGLGSITAVSTPEHPTVEQGAEIIVHMARTGPDGPTGGYFHADGVLPWWDVARSRGWAGPIRNREAPVPGRT
jgi:hypothetical protein